MVALLFVAVSVGLGNFGASAALGVSGVERGMRLRIAAIFGLFEAAMPLAGLAIGRTAAGDLGGHAGLVAGVVLCLAGGYTLIESVRSRGHEDDSDGDAPASGSGLSLGVSSSSVRRSASTISPSVSLSVRTTSSPSSLPWSSAW